MRQGRLTPEEAVEHPQRSVITRALGPEGAVEVDTRSFQARGGDVYLLCSDGLTTMVSEEDIAAALNTHPRLRDAGEALIRAANDAGGRDNVTVVLLRLKEVEVPLADGAGERRHDHRHARRHPPPTPPHGRPAGRPHAAPPGEAARRASPRSADGAVAPARGPRWRPTPGPQAPAPPPGAAPQRRRRRVPHLGALVVTLIVLALIAAGAYIALQIVYFIGTNARGLVTLYEGVPYQLPGQHRPVLPQIRLRGQRLDDPARPPQDAAQPPPALRSGRRLADPQPRTGPARRGGIASRESPHNAAVRVRRGAVRAAGGVHLAVDRVRSLLAARQPAQRPPAARAGTDQTR